MYTYICEYCGKEMTVRLKKEVHRFCSRSCVGKATMRRLHPERKTESNYKPHVCHYNEGVYCCRNNCSGCGWHPQVAEDRMKKILQERGALV